MDSQQIVEEGLENVKSSGEILIYDSKWKNQHG